MCYLTSYHILGYVYFANFYRVLSVINQAGLYPRMECHLASRIRHVRSLGIPIETWMVKSDAREILHDFYPNDFPDPAATSIENFPFKASSTWLRSFFARHGFSLRKIGTRINKRGVTGNMIDAIRDFHLATRVLQLSERNDSEYGFTSLANVYSHDQVPIALCSSYIKTVDDKGTDEVYDATAKRRDLKRFCSLNLFAPLR